MKHLDLQRISWTRNNQLCRSFAIFVTLKTYMTTFFETFCDKPFYTRLWLESKVKLYVLKRPVSFEFDPGKSFSKQSFTWVYLLLFIPKWTEKFSLQHSWFIANPDLKSRSYFILNTSVLWKRFSFTYSKLHFSIKAYLEFLAHCVGLHKRKRTVICYYYVYSMRKKFFRE